MKCWWPVTRGRNVFCWLEQRRSLASGQKMKPPIFPARRNLLPVFRQRIYWERRILAMHDIKDGDGKYDVIVWMRSTPSGSEYYAHLPVFYGKPAQMPQQGKLSHIWERAMEYLLRASLFLSTNQNCLSPPFLAPMLPTVWACEKKWRDFPGRDHLRVFWGSFEDLLRRDFEEGSLVQTLWMRKDQTWRGKCICSVQENAKK